MREFMYRDESLLANMSYKKGPPSSDDHIYNSPIE
jgi:hypothetical protein